MDERETAERAAARRYVVGRMEEGLERLPRHMHDCVRDYVLHGEIYDGFLTAVLSNDLKGAFMYADEHNRAAMQAWVGFIINYLPASAQGSAESVDAWRGGGGFDGPLAPATAPGLENVAGVDEDPGPPR